MCIYIYILIPMNERSRHARAQVPRKLQQHLTFTRYCDYQYCMVYGIRKGGRGGGRICAIVVHSYCNRVGNAGRGGNIRMINSCTEALK